MRDSFGRRGRSGGAERTMRKDSQVGCVAIFPTIRGQNIDKNHSKSVPAGWRTVKEIQCFDCLPLSCKVDAAAKSLSCGYAGGTNDRSASVFEANLLHI